MSAPTINSSDTLERFLLLAMTELADCQRDIARVLLQGPRADNTAMRSGIAIGLERTAAHVRGFALTSPLPQGQLFRHYKGGLYTRLGQVTHSETDEEFVLYKSENTGRLYVRPAAMWHESINGVPRFTPVDPAAHKES